MCRVAICLFFIAILHNGILKFSQADETTTGSPSQNEEADPANESEVPSKVEADVKIGVTSKTEEASDVPQRKDGKPTEGKANGSKKEDVTEKTTTASRNFLPNMLKGAPIEQTNILFEFPKSILGPVNVVGAKIGKVVSKGFDTAKEFADGTIHFLRTSASTLFEK